MKSIRCRCDGRHIGFHDGRHLKLVFRDISEIIADKDIIPTVNITFSGSRYMISQFTQNLIIKKNINTQYAVAVNARTSSKSDDIACAATFAQGSANKVRSEILQFTMHDVMHLHEMSSKQAFSAIGSTVHFGLNLEPSTSHPQSDGIAT